MNYEQSRHRFAARHTLPCESRHGIHVVGHDDAPLYCGPSEDIRINGLGQSDALDSNEVELRSSAQSATHEIVVNIFVREQPNHRLLFGLFGVPSSKQACTKADRVKVLLDLEFQCRALALALNHVGVKPRRYDLGSAQ